MGEADVGEALPMHTGILSRKYNYTHHQISDMPVRPKEKNKLRKESEETETILSSHLRLGSFSNLIQVVGRIPFLLVEGLRLLEATTLHYHFRKLSVFLFSSRPAGEHLLLLHSAFKS